MRRNSSSSSFAHGRRAHVLIVHPDPTMRSQIGACLGDEVRVTLCANLGEGCERSIPDPPDVVVVDPDVDGTALPELLSRRHGCLRRTPLVLLADPRTVAETILGDNVSVVGKPFSSESVRSSVRRGLLRRAA